MNETAIVVLAAGQGKRMGSALPKVLIPLNGRPMIEYVLDAISKSGVKEKPCVVVGVGADLVKSTLGDRASYANQKEQRGTAHAVMTCKENLHGKYKNVLVLYGDMPFITDEVISKLIATHLSSGAPLTMVTVTVPDFESWRSSFVNFGRIIRDENGTIEKIIEFKDCTDEQKKVTEINPSFFCFNAEWLWKNIENIGKDNAQGEYYLTDLVGIATKQGAKIATVSADPKVAVGVNTLEQLKTAEGLIK